MSLAVALIVNIVAIAALIAGLAYVMSRPKQLQPHRPFVAVKHELERLEADYEERLAA